jgi:hypothetical protein
MNILVYTDNITIYKNRSRYSHIYFYLCNQEHYYWYFRNIGGNMMKHDKTLISILKW